MTMEEFVNKLGLRIEFTPSFSPWSNGVNKRNHYSCDVIVKKVMEQDRSIVLQEAVNLASWTHNTNINVLGYSPLQLVTGKNITLPGLTSGNLATESLYDDEAVRQIMARHNEIMKEFREAEFTRKLERAKKMKSKGYEDVILKEGDVVFYQHEGKKAWLGPVKVLTVKGNSIFIFENGSIQKVARCNVQYLKSEEKEEEEKDDLPSSNNLKTFKSCVQGPPPGKKKSSHSANVRGCGDSSKEKKEKVVDNEHRVDFKEGDFGEEIDEEDIEEISRR